MSVQFVIDSGADTTPAERQAQGLHLVPLRVIFPDGEFLDGVDITPPEFYRRMAASESLPTTSMASAYDFETVIGPLVDQGDEVVVLTISGALSGTVQSACMAAEEYPGRVFVVDSLNITCGIRVQLEYAMRLREKGLSAADIARELVRAQKRVRLVGLLETLENLKKGGRLSKTAAFAGELLGVKPVVQMKDGAVQILGKARGMKHGREQMIQRIYEAGDIDFTMPVWIGYTGENDSAKTGFLDAASDQWEGRLAQAPCCHAGSCIGTHAGPGVVAVAFYARES